MNTIKDCFDIISRGNQDESRLAARTVRVLLYSSRGDRSKYQEIKEIIDGASRVYSTMQEEWRQEDFITALSVIYFLRDKDAQPDFLFPLLFQLLQHHNGRIRYAAVRMYAHEIGPLTLHLRFPEEVIIGDRLSPKHAESILYSLCQCLGRLASVLWHPKYKKYKYVDSLPTSPYKSVQMVFAELEECCGTQYVYHLINSTRMV